MISPILLSHPLHPLLFSRHTSSSPRILFWGGRFIPCTSIHAMHHNADVKTSLSLGFIRPLRRSASNREVAHEIHVVHPAVESTRRARQCRGTTEEKLRREQRSPCLISPREIYERGSTTGFFLRLFPRCIFCAPLSWFPLRKESVNSARFFDPAVHRDAQ